MADDAGALLVRSGLVSPNALEDARARVASIGGTLGEQLVTAGAIADDDLTDFYRSRLLVPQVNPNMLARLTPNVVAAIPTDMAIELRAIPVSLDAENNLTVAMSDPSDRHAVDEIAFFTGAYVVRAVATQMQIAWCLAHYYGHVTALGQRLLRLSPSEVKAATPSPPRLPRAKGLTGKVNATRHRAVAPITGPVDVIRPSSGPLDLERLTGAAAAASGAMAMAASAGGGANPGAASAGASTGAIGGGSGGAIGGAITGAATAGAASSGSGSAEPAQLTVPGVIRPNPLISANLAAANARASAAAVTDTSPTIPVRSSGPIETLARAVAAVPAASAAASPAPAPVGAENGHRATKPGVVATPPAGVGTVPTAGPHTPTLVPGAITAAGIAVPAAATAAAARAASDGGSSAATSPVSPASPPSPPSQPSPASSASSAQLPASSAQLPAVVLTDGEPPGAPVDAIEDEPPARMQRSPDARADGDGAPEKPRARSVSGEIRVPVRRAPSIKPLLPQPDLEDDEEPLIMIEMREEDDETGPRPLPIRRRPIVKSDPPELKARAGEVDLKSGADHAIDVHEPRIVVDEDALAPETGRIATRPATDQRPTAPLTTIDVVDDADTGALIHDRVIDRMPESLDAADVPDVDDADTGEIDIVMLDAPKRPRPERPERPERRTQLGVGPVHAGARAARDTDAGLPAGLGGDRADELLGDATSVDLRPAPPGDDTTSDQLAAPPAPASDDDTNPHVFAAPPAPAPASRTTAPLASRSSAIPRALIVEDDGDDDAGPATSEMTAAELDDAVPERASEVPSEQLLRRRVDYDAVDDGWGPPGTTIPPPLLGAIPGSEDYEEQAGAIPMPNVDSSPLIVSPPSLPSAGEAGGRALVRALEDATARAIDVIRQLEHTASRDEVVEVMIRHLAETHHRAGFFVTKHTVTRDAGELALFAMTPRPGAMPAATLRLDRASTLQDVVGTRLPYRGPMHDDASRAFLVSVLGACPAEILLVPVTVRERVVGVLFGEHRQRHTFDDQVALAARAAGMALERILRARRGP